MDGERFDTLVREVANPTSRRRIVGGVLGVAALVAGTAVIKAKPGGGKGNTKKTICHFSNGKGGKYKKMTLGGPGADNHVAKHEEDGYVAEVGGCCPGDTCTATQGQCFTAECTKDTTTSTFSCVESPADAGTECTVNGLPGQCNGAGLCCDFVNPPTCV